MQQRQLRLGDILDDYCPRERRLANHTIVAMVGDEVRLTRCTTCDTEHPYKGGKVPRQRKKTSVQAAYDEVLDSVKKDGDVPGTLVTRTEEESEAVDGSPQAVGTAPVESAEAPEPAESESAESAEPAPQEIRLHRPLIRASLPRTAETQPTPRPIPEFTIRQASRQGRFQKPGGGRFAAKGRNGSSNGQGNTRGQGGQFGRGPGGRPPQGAGGGHGRRPGQNQGRKRSR